MILEERLKRSIALRSDEVFIRAEFAYFGSEAQVSRALRRLVNKGYLVKLGVGIYAKAKISKLSGNPIPIKPIDILAPVALRKLGVKLFPSKATQEYNEGKTTQIPSGIVFNTGDRLITRKIGFGKRTVSYETTKRK